ncbi:MAG: glycoside hydrolase family 25 protein [Lachnospiraceae bacterium]|nr:glycoside hydrolase family 25 protein [Lachnospiraceae bacterium]
MDSKLKRITLIAALSVVLLVFLVVVLINSEQKNTEAMGPGQGTKHPQSSEQETADISDRLLTGQIGDDLSAFLTDNSFFDREDTYLTQLEELMNRLSLVVTSVERDLRIQIVDYTGEPVIGRSFYVEIENLGEYKDLDKDGVIYIGDMEPGEYSVSLKPVDGYKVPTNSTKVRVKEQVEYMVIDDISLLVKTEDEINVLVEDFRQAISDGDQTEVEKRQTTENNTTLGIDVSKWNGEIDWEKVKADGVEFAIIRCGYRGYTEGSLVEDPYFAQNIKGAVAAGLKVGVYFFTQAVNEVEAVEEASMVVSLIRDYDLEYPVFIDTESAGGTGRADALDIQTRTKVCEAFCATVQNAGYKPGVYASRNWYTEQVEATELEDFVIWLAEYRKVPLYQGYYQMWQYTSKGTVDGIEGNVDLNLSYLKY